MVISDQDLEVGDAISVSSTVVGIWARIWVPKSVSSTSGVSTSVSVAAVDTESAKGTKLHAQGV